METPKLKDILNSPVYSYWLKDALQAALTRDPVDAVNDAELLLMLLEQRLSRYINTEVK